MIKIGFIGFGNIASAMASGFNLNNKVKMYASARNYEKLVSNTLKYNVTPCKNNKELIDSVDFVVLAVKPYQVSQIFSEIKEYLADKILISVVAGLTFSTIEEFIPNIHHISICPNTPVAVGEGIIVYETINSLTNDEFSTFEDVFSELGLIETIDTEHFSLAGTVSGCTPAYAAMFIEALGDAGVMFGLTREQSYRFASQVLIGTGKLQQTSKLHPGQMKDAVCSPGGTTIKGVGILEKNGFRSSIIEAIKEIENK